MNILQWRNQELAKKIAVCGFQHRTLCSWYTEWFTELKHIEHCIRHKADEWTMSNWVRETGPIRRIRNVTCLPGKLTYGLMDSHITYNETYLGCLPDTGSGVTGDVENPYFFLGNGYWWWNLQMHMDKNKPSARNFIHPKIVFGLRSGHGEPRIHRDGMSRAWPRNLAPVLSRASEK